MHASRITLRHNGEILVAVSVVQAVGEQRPNASALDKSTLVEFPQSLVVMD